METLFSQINEALLKMILEVESIDLDEFRDIKTIDENGRIKKTINLEENKIQQIKNLSFDLDEAIIKMQNFQSVSNDILKLLFEKRNTIAAFRDSILSWSKLLELKK